MTGFGTPFYRYHNATIVEDIFRVPAKFKSHIPSKLLDNLPVPVRSPDPSHILWCRSFENTAKGWAGVILQQHHGPLIGVLVLFQHDGNVHFWILSFCGFVGACGRPGNFVYYPLSQIYCQVSTQNAKSSKMTLRSTNNHIFGIRKIKSRHRCI